MKKYLMMALAALAIVSCSKSDDVSEGGRSKVEDTYKAAFVKYVGGSIASNQTWGFSSNAYTRGMAFTRANAVISGDPFTFEETSGYYKTTIPDKAQTLDKFIPSGWTSVDWGAVQNCTELKLGAGTHSLHLWSGSRDIYIDGNVVLNVLDDATSINQARIYLIPNSTLTLNMPYYINNLEIYVAANATLNYNAPSLYKQTGGGKIYSKGTVNFAENFEANQNSIVYNEGTMTGTNITSKPGDGNSSFFYNFGDLTLNGKLELNSCANFYNEGTVNVAGETSVTQKNIWWINKGHYTTGTMVFSAKNSTFYNYCQLVVEGNTHMYDGEFNLMDNSYIVAATAEFDNFIVNMGSNSGFNINGNTNWEAQGDGEYQGFKATGTRAYVRLGGTTTVAGHLRSLELTGNITYAINNLVDLGAGNTGVQPTHVFNSGTTAVDFDKLNVTYNDTDCGATWTIGGTPSADLRIIAEDLSASQASDFDFNDIVLDVKYGYPAVLTLQAAGGTLPLRINGDDNLEVHKLFEVGVKEMVNTQAGPSKPAVTIDETKGFNMNINSPEDAANLKIEVQKEDGTWYELKAPVGDAASKIAVDASYDWLIERASIKDSYPNFVQWVNGGFPARWWDLPGE